MGLSSFSTSGETRWTTRRSRNSMHGEHTRDISTDVAYRHIFLLSTHLHFVLLCIIFYRPTACFFFIQPLAAILIKWRWWFIPISKSCHAMPFFSEERVYWLFNRYFVVKYECCSFRISRFWLSKYAVKPLWKVILIQYRQNTLWHQTQCPNIKLMYPNPTSQLKRLAHRLHSEDQYT